MCKSECVCVCERLCVCVCERVSQQRRCEEKQSQCVRDERFVFFPLRERKTEREREIVWCCIAAGQRRGQGCTLPNLPPHPVLASSSLVTASYINQDTKA